MSRLLVPDTNIFVHFHSFATLPWREIGGCEDVEVVVLAAVVRELDKLKLEPRVQDRVREVLPQLDALFAASDTASLKDGTPMRFEHGIGIRNIMQEYGLEPHYGDDRILAAILRLIEAREDVAIVSDDTAVRLRARGLGIAVRSIPESYRRSSSHPLQAENAKLRRELDDLRNAAPKLALQFLEGGTRLNLIRDKPPPPKRRSLEDTLRMRPLSLDNLPLEYTTAMRETPTEDEINAYNVKLEAYRESYAAYEKEREEFELFPHLSIALELSIGNSGGKLAEGLSLSLQLPDDVTVVKDDEVPSQPPKPIAPRLPGRGLGIVEAFGHLGRMMAPALAANRYDSLASIQSSFGDLNVSGPLFSTGEVRFTVRQISNFDDVVLPRCFLRFPSLEAVRSFGAKYKLRSHTLSRIIEGELHFIVSTDDRPAKEA